MKLCEILTQIENGEVVKGIPVIEDIRWIYKTYSISKNNNIFTIEYGNHCVTSFDTIFTRYPSSIECHYQKRMVNNIFNIELEILERKGEKKK